MRLSVPTSPRAILVLLFAASVLLALGLTAWVAPRIGRSRVDVALDLDAPLFAPPVVSYGAGASGEAIAMERVPDRFAQSIGAYGLQANRHVPTTGTLTVPIPSAGTYPRYVASVPRRALGALRFDFAPGDKPDIRRIYMGSFRPTVRFADPRPWPPQVWGAIASSCVFPPPGQAIVLPSLSPWEQGRRRTWVLVWAVAMAALLGLEAAGWCAWRLLRAAGREPVEPAPLLAPWSWRAYLAFLLSAWAVWAVWLGAFWPSSMCVDAWEAWDEMLKGRLMDLHPPFFTLTVWGLTRLWFTPSVVSLAQMAALGAACAAGFTLLVRAHVPRWAVLTAWVALLASPTVGFLAAAVIRDTFYTAAVMGLIVMAAGLALEPARRRGWVFWTGMGVLLALVPLYRYNGLLVAPPFAVLLWVMFRPLRRGLGGACVVGLVLFALVRYGLFGMVHVEHGPLRFGTIYPAWVASCVLANAPPLSGEDAEFLDRLRPLHEVWPYWPGVSVGAIYGGNGAGALNIALAGQEQRRFLGVLGRICERSPGLVLRHLLRATDYLYRVPRQAGFAEFVLAVQMSAAYEAAGRQSAAHGFPPAPLFPSANRVIRRWLPRLYLDPPAGVTGGWVIWRPALRLYLVLAGACVVWWRLRRPRLLLPFVPVFLNTVSLATGMSWETRYQMPLFVAGGFLLCLALLPRQANPVSPTDSRNLSESGASRDT